MTDYLREFSSVRRHLNRPLPATLWHYTSYEGFLGILESKQIWASEIRHLNDASEFEHGRDIVKIEVERLASLQDDTFLTGKLATDLIRKDLSDGFLSSGKVNLYVISFSENGDQLSQWRGYTPTSRGVSIGFDLKHLRPDSAAGAFQFLSPCIYEQEPKLSLIRDCVNGLTEAALTWKQRSEEHYSAIGSPKDFEIDQIPEEIRNILHDTALGMGLSLLKLMPLFKHPSFSEESEWRFVGNPKEPVPDGLSFLRVGPTGFVPTLRAPLLRKDGTLPVTHVRIGPCPNPALQKRAVELLLERKGLSHVEVSDSGSPFRAW